jgi:hypothetical protein
MTLTRIWTLVAAVALLVSVALARTAEPLFIAPLYVEYSSSTPQEFTAEAKQLKERIGSSGPSVKVGFSAFLGVQFRMPELDQPVSPDELAPTLDDIALMVDRARSNHIPLHISVVSNLFHGVNSLREAAIRADVRNAEWFEDGWIAVPEEINRSRGVPRSAWITPSSYALPLRHRIEESTRILGERLAAAMEQSPDTLISISGDSEVELSYERTLEDGERLRGSGKIVYADYSPFMVSEFRDWLRDSRYKGDLSPATDDNHDGRTLNRDFHQQFRTWDLRYFNNSGPIPYEQYRAMKEKLPASGELFIEGGFDAPRSAAPRDPFWETWKTFRIRIVSNYLRDFAKWITNDSRIPASRFYTHQIPADYVFAGRNALRLETSASPLETALLPAIASPGVTVFDTFNGRTYTRTSNPDMFRRLEKAGSRWGILEYNPSVPPTEDEKYYTSALHRLYSFHPAIIAPFAWTHSQLHKQYRIQDTAFERALKKLVEEIQRR